MEELLGIEHFMRVNKSYIIGFDHVEFIEGNCIYINGKSIPIGSSYKPLLLERLTTRMIGKR